MITVRVTLPSGLLVPYFIDPLLPARELLKMAKQDTKTRICFNGTLLRSGLSLKCQGVRDNDHVVLYRYPEIQEKLPIDGERQNSRLENVYSLMKEAMRIDDVNMMRMEEFGEPSMEESEGESEEDVPRERLVIVEGEHVVASDPLPVLWREETVPDSYDVPLRPYFSSIEETGKFLMKQIHDEWTW